MLKPVLGAIFISLAIVALILVLVSWGVAHDPTYIFRALAHDLSGHVCTKQQIRNFTC